MREIKFRAWHKETGEWYYGSSLITDINQGDGHCLTLSLFWLKVEKGWLDIKTVGQYTGLKDKNGREIYEGDVVEYYERWSDDLEKCVVEWDEDLAGFSPFCEYDADCDVYVDESTVNVIGNIHENPKLLEEKK